MLRLSTVDGVVPNWRGILENWSDDSCTKVKQLLWWDSCTVELFKEIESLAKVLALATIVLMWPLHVKFASRWTPISLKVLTRWTVPAGVIGGVLTGLRRPRSFSLVLDVLSCIACSSKKGSKIVCHIGLCVR